MKKYTILLISTLLLVFVKYSGWASGYYLNPAVLGFFTPFILLPMIFIVLFTATYQILKILKKSNRNKATILLGVSHIVILILLFSPLIPNSYDGFHYRMSRYSQNDYIDIANKVKLSMEDLGVSETDLGYPRNEKQELIVKALTDEYPLFSYSEWPIHISTGKEYVSLSWSSGLTGGYGVVILTDAQTPQWLKTWPVTPVYLYDNVALILE